MHYASLLDVARLIEAREISPVELTEAMLDRIVSLDGRLHSYITVTADRAMAAARAAEAEIVAGRYRGPLHGVPIAVKDDFFTVDAPTTLGHAFLRGVVPDYDATAVDRLRRRGAVLLGKLNLTEGTLVGYSPAFPIPVNPWDETLSPGWSSSGSGVATAAGLCFGSLGTDAGGSIRFPSEANGVVGLKPTFGRVSRYGLMPLTESMDHVGSLARHVADAVVMFEAIAGRDPDDPTSLADPVPAILPALDGDVRGMRVGFDPVYATEGIETGLRGAVTDALAVLESMGAEVVPVTMPTFTADHFDMWGAIAAYEALRAHAAWYPSRAEEYGPAFRDFLEAGTTITRDAYAAVTAGRNDFSGRFREALSGVDAVLSPSGHGPYPASLDPGYQGLDALQLGAESPRYRFTFPANFAGTPAITVPAGVAPSGAPYAVQLMGGRLTEPSLCRLAYAFEQATEWSERHPAL